MSIRLRLTLLYTAILALTLIAFGGVLYGTQAQSTRGREEMLLSTTAQRVVEYRQSGDAELVEYPFFPKPPREGGGPPDWRTSSPRNFLYVQVLSPDGNVIAASQDLGQGVLILSEAGLEAALRGETWEGSERIEDERFLLHSAPVVVDGEVIEIVQIARPLTEQDRHLDALARNLLFVGSVAIVAAFGVGWLLSGLALRPVNRITQTAHTIGVEQDLSRRVDHSGPNDEIGRLANTVNEMLNALQGAYQQQQQFVADVSHELRTPLTTIRGNLALLRRKPAVTPREQSDILDDVTEESERLVRLVNDLLTLAHAESGRQLRSEAIRIRPLVEEVCRQARLLDPERTITCSDLDDATAIGDQDALKQILLILMDNGLKHTTGAIAVSVKESAEHVSLRVQDEGPGIPQETLPHVFERFHRGENGPTVSGIGLGLAIAQALVEAQGGTILVDSHIDQGSTFTVTLPVAAPA